MRAAKPEVAQKQEMGKMRGPAVFNNMVGVDQTVAENILRNMGTSTYMAASEVKC
jgi:hypothetical protein